MTTQKTNSRGLLDGQSLFAIALQQQHFLVTLIIALCVFAGCKDEDKPTETHFIEKSLVGTNWNGIGSNLYAPSNISFLADGICICVNSNNENIETAYHYQYPDVRIDNFPIVPNSINNIYAKGTANITPSQINLKLYDKDTDEELEEKEYIYYLVIE